MMRNQVMDMIEKEKLIVIVRGVEREKLIFLAEAMYEGGVRLLELTFDAAGHTTDEEISESIALLTKHFQGRMYIGAGTVLTEKQVELTANAGGCFVISPDANEAVIKKTREMEMVSIPGALTPTEIQAAHCAGADFVKLFPAGAMGASYVKAIRAPLSHIRLLAVGGIDTHNIAEYQKVGICGFGIGSGIVDPRMLAAMDGEAITALAKKYVAVIKNASCG